MSFELTANGYFVERLDPETEVIDVSSFLPWWRPADHTKLTTHRDEIDKRVPGAKLNQTDGFLPPFDRATEYTAIEAKHAVKVDDAQHKVVDLTDVNHWV